MKGMQKEILEVGEMCYLTIVDSKMGCNTPVIFKDGGVYKFDTYGINYLNMDKWDKVSSYGAFGTSGQTTDLNIIFEALFFFNKVKKELGIVSRDVYNDLVNSNYGDRIAEVYID